MLPKEIEMSSVDIWQQDETRVGQQGCPTRIWARRGTRPRKAKQRQFISTYIYGAACAETGASCGLVMPEVNTQSMQLFLDELSSIISMGRHAALIIDNAGWHTSHELQVPNNITLIRLPPYSPELNAMEQVWAWIKDRFLSNRCYKDYKDIVDHVCDAWNKFSDDIELVKSICFRKWQQTPRL